MNDFNLSMDVLEQREAGAVKKDRDLEKVKNHRVKIRILEDKKYFTDKENVRKMKAVFIRNAFKKKLLAMALQEYRKIKEKVGVSNSIAL